MRSGLLLQTVQYYTNASLRQAQYPPASEGHDHWARTAVFVGWGRFDAEINRIRANIPLIPLRGSCSGRP